MLNSLMHARKVERNEFLLTLLILVGALLQLAAYKYNWTCSHRGCVGRKFLSK